jgi:nitrite reductase/ring-hydroxylating ferredoxin subunit
MDESRAFDACRDCPTARSRRDFVRGATAAVATMLVALGVDPERAFGLPVDAGTAEREPDGSVRYPVPSADGVTIDKTNEIILVRQDSTIHAFALSCPHQRTMLRWLDREGRFQCPKHKSKYEPDGSFISGRATRGMDRYPLRLDGDAIVVLTSAAIQEDENASAWAAATVRIDA